MSICFGWYMSFCFCSTLTVYRIPSKLNDRITVIMRKIKWYFTLNWSIFRWSGNTRVNAVSYQFEIDSNQFFFTKSIYLVQLNLNLSRKKVSHTKYGWKCCVFVELNQKTKTEEIIHSNSTLVNISISKASIMCIFNDTNSTQLSVHKRNEEHLRIFRYFVFCFLSCSFVLNRLFFSISSVLSKNHVWREREKIKRWSLERHLFNHVIFIYCILFLLFDFVARSRCWCVFSTGIPLLDFMTLKWLFGMDFDFSRWFYSIH